MVTMATSVQACQPPGKTRSSLDPSYLRGGERSSTCYSAHRKSAVERLEESKANYVKSDRVLDARQCYGSPMTHPDVLLKVSLNQVHPTRPTILRPRAKSQSLVAERRKFYPVVGVPEDRRRSNEDIESQLKMLILSASKDQLPQQTFYNYSNPNPNRSYESFKAFPKDLNQASPSNVRRIIHNSPDILLPSLRTISLNNSSTCSSLSTNHWREGAGCSDANFWPQRHESPTNSYGGDIDDNDDIGDLPISRYGSHNSRRPVTRSKSDVCPRKPPPMPPPKRNSYSSMEVESFFDSMGLDPSVWAAPPAESPTQFFESVSSLESYGSRSSDEGSNDSNNRRCLTNQQLMNHGPIETSIVEKNARVIKWLYNCRKAKTES